MSTDRTTDPSETSAQKQLYLLIATYGLVLVAGFNAGWIGPLLPVIADQLKMPVTDLGTLFSIQFFGCLITMTMGKKILDWLGIKNSLWLAAGLSCLGFFAYAFSPIAIFLWLGAFLLGTGTGINTIAGTIAVLRLVQGNSATALNRVHLLFGLGALLGPLLAWLAHHSPWSFRAAFFFGGVLALLFFLVIAQASDLPKRQAEREPPPSKETMKSPLLWLYSFTMFFYVGIETGAGAWLFVYLTKASELPLVQASLGMSALWLGLTLSRHFGGNLCKKYSPQNVVLSFMLLSLLMLITLAAVPQLSVLTLLVVCLIGFGFGPVFPTILALATSKYSHSTALVTTVTITTGFTGGMIYPWAVGKIFEQAGLSTGMYTLVGGAAIMLLLFSLTMKSMHELHKNEEESNSDASADNPIKQETMVKNEER